MFKPRFLFKNRDLYKDRTPELTRKIDTIIKRIAAVKKADKRDD